MFASAFLPSSHYNHVPYSSVYDSCPRSCLAEQRQFARQRELERQNAYARRLRRAQYLPDEDDEYRQPYFTCGPSESAYAERLRRDAFERRIKQEQLRQKLEQQKRAEAQAARDYWQSLKDSYTVHQPSREPSSSSLSSPQTTTLPTRTNITPTPSPNPSPSSPTLSPERYEEAATRIQAAYRVHRAIIAINDLEQHFNASRASFTFPSAIDFQGPDGILSLGTHSTEISPSTISDAPKLAFTPTNYSLHAYIEGLNRLLVKLDAIDSRGNASVRRHRRRVVGAVEAEANRVEALWKQVWAARAEGTGDDSGMSADIEQRANEDATSDVVDTNLFADAEGISEETREPVDVGMTSQVLVADTEEKEESVEGSEGSMVVDTQGEEFHGNVGSEQMEIGTDEERDMGWTAASDQPSDAANIEPGDVSEPADPTTSGAVEEIIEGQPESIDEDGSAKQRADEPSKEEAENDVGLDGSAFVMV